MSMDGQRIEYFSILLHKVFSQILDLYYDISKKDVGSISGVSFLNPLIKVLERGYGKDINFDGITPTQLSSCQFVYPRTNNVVVCFSGGKDSTALAMLLKNMGKNVFLYHVRGINKSYPDEVNRAVRVASLLELPLYIDEVKLIGGSIYKENPLKNQVIATLALNYSISQHLDVSIAFGDFTEDTAERSVFDRNWSDCVEMWNAYREVISKIVPNFELHIPFKNYLETLLVVGREPTLLNAVQGCLAPQRFRRHWHDMNEKKYKVSLLPNRCGSCWKCCVEYLYLTDNNLLEYNEAFYLHCLELLRSKIPEEHPSCVGVKSYEDVYKVYIKAPVPERVKKLSFN